MAANEARGFVVRKGSRELLEVIKREGNRILAQDGDHNVWLADGTYYYTKLLSTEPEPTRRKSVGEFTVDIDCSEALTGLKAVQREAKEATKALRELEEARGKTKFNADRTWSDAYKEAEKEAKKYGTGYIEIKRGHNDLNDFLFEKYPHLSDEVCGGSDLKSEDLAIRLITEAYLTK